MRKPWLLGLILIATSITSAQEHPLPPKPEKEHQWLQQFVGEWTTDAEVIMEPGKPPTKCEGTESVRTVGGMWTISEIKSTPAGQPMVGIMTLGFDPQKKRFIGTWIDNSGSHLWKYEGSLDATGKILTLESEGPSMTAPSKMAKYRDVTEIKNKDHKILTSSIQDNDGQWTHFMTMHSRRKN